MPSAGQLGYTPEQIEATLKEVADSYGADRGAGMLRAAFE